MEYWIQAAKILIFFKFAPKVSAMVGSELHVLKFLFCNFNH